MKAFIAVLSLAAAVCGEPEADPALLYAGAGYPYAAGPLAYGAYGAPAYGAGLAYGAYAAPRGFAYSTASYAPYANYFGARLFKREAEAEAEADPALLYNGAFAASPLAYSGYAAGPYAAGLGYSGYHGLGYSGLGYSGLGYAGLGYAGLAHPYHVAAPAAVPAVPGGYAAAGRYVANSAGVVHVAKREAEAEADPALLYANAGYGYAHPAIASTVAYSAPAVASTVAYASHPIAYGSYYNNYAYAAGYPYAAGYAGRFNPYFGAYHF